MEKNTVLNPLVNAFGHVIYFLGWFIFIASIFFGLANKDSSPKYESEHFIAILLLAFGSIIYLALRKCAESAKLKAFADHLRSFPLGMSCWVFLYISFGILDQIVN